MDRYAILTDAGYFFAAAGAALSPGQGKIKRSDILLKSPATLLTQLQSLCDPLCTPATLLRMYWYDAPPRGMTPSSEQLSLGSLPYIKLRMGNLNNQGQQKGVDSLIITDLIDLARNTAISDVFLISGDEDLRIGVSVTQSYGVRVHLLGIGDVANNTSARLVMESDGQIVADLQWITNVLEIRQRAITQAANPTLPPSPSVFTNATPTQGLSIRPPIPTPAPAPAPTLVAGSFSGTVSGLAQQTIEDLLKTRTPVELASLKALLTTPKSIIPPEYDGKLLATIGKTLGRRLDQAETSLVRRLLRAAASK